MHVNNFKITITDLDKVNVLIPTVVSPVLIQFKKKKNYLYIYNSNNYLVKYDLNSIMNDNIPFTEYSPEFVLEDLQISAFTAFDEIIIYSLWDDYRIFIYNKKAKRTEILTEYDSESEFVTGIVIFKHDGAHFLYVSLSSGKLLFYKFASILKFNF